MESGDTSLFAALSLSLKLPDAVHHLRIVVRDHLFELREEPVKVIEYLSAENGVCSSRMFFDELAELCNIVGVADLCEVNKRLVELCVKVKVFIGT